MIDLLTGTAFDAPKQMNHREDEVALEFPSSVSSQSRGLLALKAQNWRAGGGAPLPYDEELAYLESNSLQYIVTDVMPETVVRWEMDVQFLAAKTNYNGSYFGSDFRFDIATEPNHFRINYGAGNNLGTADGLFARSFMVMDVPAGACSINDHNYTLPKKSIGTNTRPVYLFARNNAGTVSLYSSQKLYSTKFVCSDRTLDFIPVLKDGVPCLYEKVGGTFLYNKSAGHQFGYETHSGVHVSPS